jgi:hypothetical protein
VGASWRRAQKVAIKVGSDTITTFWALRQLAPTRLTLAGALAGLFAGGAGAFVYAFHCPETAAPFVALWYSAGILLTAGLGALLGPRLLRW